MQVQTLKRELQLALKALEQEVGQSIAPAVILKGNSGWKGRADQVFDCRKHDLLTRS